MMAAQLSQKDAIAHEAAKCRANPALFFGSTPKLPLFQGR
jgi:hypothetical protein